MPTRLTPRHQRPYFLVCVDKHGVERREEDGSLLSERILETIRTANPPITDVFVMSHGWKGDVPAAIDQYDRWIDAMGDCTEDRALARTKRPGFTSLLIGFHWPSLPFGEDDMGGNAFSTTSAGGGADAFVEQWADRIADTPAARDALRTLFAQALDDLEPDRLNAATLLAYQTLDREAALANGSPAAAPGADRAGFDAQAAYLDARDDEASFSGGIMGALLSPLRQLSFWQMKKRARVVGETGGHALLAALRAAGGNALRLHLMGHSFGCIVVSSMLRGTDTSHPVRAASVILVQGALSLWSFAKQLPDDAREAGWFRPVVDAARIEGPLVITTSKFDTAVGKLYPAAAGVAGQVAFNPAATTFPTFGALGTFGAQGPGTGAKLLTLTPGDRTRDLHLEPGTIYNVIADAVIKTGGGLSGAHSDIDHPEVGHLCWSAALVTA
ncbi:MAG: hypothetical protein MUF00_13885 [Gemmatimonadaceae bacterium]|jgi:hypothetical protein|nr:hypothetical protein [Gemmatimonadaceae bacterium]